jgi:membrane-associated phospholipid phosphatase
MVWAVLVFPMAFRYANSPTQALMWGFTYGILVCLMPLLYIVWMVRRGKITDLHMKERRERLRPFVFSMICTTIAWQILRAMGAPPMLPMVAIFTLVELIVMSLITLVWQISMHAMSIGVAVVATGIVFGPASALVICPLMPIVGIARLKLERHTLSQVVAGLLLGAIIPLLLLPLL